MKISEAVGLYFNIINNEDVKKNSSPFTVSYSEWRSNKKQQTKKWKRPGIKIKFRSETDSAFKVHDLNV